MNNLKSNWEWSLEYTGDPQSFDKRGEIITKWLKELGMTPESRVLDIGCGNLNTGVHLIRFLNPGRYVGIDVNGWLVNAALEQFPDLPAKAPRFLWNSEFDASEVGVTFDFVVSHSVMSHMAHDQFPQALAAVRAVVDEGAVWLSSFRADQFNSLAKEWVYPGHSTFRLQTIEAWGVHFGWQVKIRHDLQKYLAMFCPNDVHDWLELTACPSMAEWNARRLAEDERIATELKSREIAEERHRWHAKSTDDALLAGAADLKRLYADPPPRLVYLICQLCGGTDEHGHRPWCVSDSPLERCEAVLSGETRCQRERHHEGNHAYTSPVDGQGVQW